MSGGELGLPPGAAGRSPAGRGELLPALGLNLGLILLVLLLRWLWARRRPAPRRPRALPGRPPAALPVGLSQRAEPLVPLLMALCADRRALVLGGPSDMAPAGAWPTGAALHLSDPVLLSDVQAALSALDAGGPPVPVVLVGPVLRLEGPMSPQQVARALPGRAVLLPSDGEQSPKEPGPPEAAALGRRAVGGDGAQHPRAEGVELEGEAAVAGPGAGTQPVVVPMVLAKTAW